MESGPLSQDSSIINYANPDEKDNSKLQVIFSNGIAKGNYKNPSTYKKVKALLLCWEEKCDDLSVHPEVTWLKSVLETRFHYEAQIETIDNNNVEQRVQVCVNAIVANFVHKNDGSDNLLIVYYSGHGRPGSSVGDLDLFGQTSPNDETKRLDRLVWNNTEDILRPAAADVLEIFDCCYAGHLTLKKGPQTNIELIAATDQGSTPPPGDESFTSALIWALESLVEEGRFTTNQLANIITEAPKFPKNQRPVISNRNRNNNASPGRIMLYPLRKATSNVQNPSKEDTLDDLARRQILSLDFEFDAKPTETQIGHLAEKINEMFEYSSVKVNGIRWGHMRSKAVKAAAPFINSLRRIRSNSGSGRVLAPINTFHRSQDTLAPPTPKSTGPSSPQMSVSVDLANVVIDVPLLSPIYFSRLTGSDEESDNPAKRLRQI